MVIPLLPSRQWPCIMSLSGSRSQVTPSTLSPAKTLPVQQQSDYEDTSDDELEFKKRILQDVANTGVVLEGVLVRPSTDLMDIGLIIGEEVRHVCTLFEHWRGFGMTRFFITTGGETGDKKWRQLFDKYDPEGYGEIPWDNLLQVLVMPDFIAEVCPNKREILAKKAQERKTTAITFQDFVNVMTDKRRRSFKCALHHRDGQVSSQNDFHILFKEPPVFSRMVHVIANEFLTDERDRKYYADHYTCWPPPFFIITITLVELCFFTYYTLMTGEMNPSRPVPTDSIFIYRPDKRLQVWRFVFYMVLHAGWLHLLFNLLVQVLVGLPLEMVHGSFRIGIVYMAGVLAGSLGTSVFDTEVYLVGASGGVYALLAAHLANILLNFNNMEFGVVRLIGIFVIVSADVGFAVYDRHAAEMLDSSLGCHPVSYVAHLTGALAGLTIGLLVLKNFEQKLHEQLIWWIALGVYAACTIFAILFNICSPSYTDQ